MPNYSQAIAELNRIADAELGTRQAVRKRHRHAWHTDQNIREALAAGNVIRFTCAIPGCHRLKAVKRSANKDHTMIHGSV